MKRDPLPPVSVMYFVDIVPLDPAPPHLDGPTEREARSDLARVFEGPDDGKGYRRRQALRRGWRVSPAWIAVAAGVAMLAVLYAIWILEVPQ